MVDKLDAMHWRSQAEGEGHFGERPRDIYDLARLLSSQEVLARLNADLVKEIHGEVIDKLPPGLAYRRAERPAGGFADSDAFNPGHPACDALRASYPTVRQFVYTDEDWVEFDDAIETIHRCSHLI